MSTRRRMAVSKKLRGPGGEALCRWCRKPVQPPRRSYCGPDCVHEWKLRRNPGYVRACVLKRDDGICALCGLDTIAEYHRLQLLKRTDPEAWADEVTRRKIPTRRGSLWDADHIRPVAEGGGECGLENYQSLCVFCHRAKTKAMAQARTKPKE